MDEQQKSLVEELLFSSKKASGFAKSLYFGSFRSDIAFPYPKLPEDEGDLKEFLEKIEHFASREIDAEKIDRHAEIPPSVIQGLGQLGVLGMTIPQKYGGLGMSQQAYCRVAELIASHCASTALFLNAHQSIGLKALLLFGTEEQRLNWLPSLAKGEKIAAFSLTEPNAGSDASGIETKAMYHPETHTYRINGKKQWTTNGSLAHVLTVMAKTEIETPQGKKEKITAFLVTPDLPGFKVTQPALEKVGMRGTKTANLEFVNMEVPEKNILGPIGSGLKVCLSVLDYGRTTFGATCTGAAKVLVRDAVRQARERYQFKKPLAAFGLVKKKISQMAALAFAMEATTYFTAGLIDAGHEDIMLESAILKVFTSEALWSILYDTMQIYGGRSFFTDYPYERMMRDARLNMIGEGSNEVLRAFIGAVGMRDVGLELKGLLEVMKNPYKEWSLCKNACFKLFGRLWTPKIELPSTQFRSEASALASIIRKFGLSIIRLLNHYREEVVDKQLELERIANSAIAIYTATAVLSKLDNFNPSESCASQQILSGKLYFQMAFEEAQYQLNKLFSPNDRKLEFLAEEMTGVR